jgi:hypothetical protein
VPKPLCAQLAGHQEYLDQIVLDRFPQARLNVFSDHDIGIAPEELAELDPHSGQVQQREFLRRWHADQQLDIALAAGIAARQRPKQPKP